ncbi:MAG: aspartate kinase [Hydrogenibacillus schlegelii]|nr:aspartate kinase [Hydrogenibacillus schlegelii]
MRIVQKYGGSSVKDADRIRAVAARIAARHREGHELAVVVSAMGRTTDDLIALAEAVVGDRRREPAFAREMDMLLSTGEQVSIALLAMALKALDVPAVSLTGWQAGILTEAVHERARIRAVDAKKLRGLLAERTVAIVAGFQGITAGGEITTLGRGGSDTTAVALAVALGADRCEIYTDVPGVYTTDPRIEPRARLLPTVTYDEMLELAHLGAGVLHPRSVELAKRYRMPLFVGSSYTDEGGTLIVETRSTRPGDVRHERSTGAASYAPDRSASTELKARSAAEAPGASDSTGAHPDASSENSGGLEDDRVVSGVALDKAVARLTLVGLSLRPTTLADLFEALAAAGVNVDIIIHTTRNDGTTDVAFSVQEDDVDRARAVLDGLQATLGHAAVEVEADLAKVSIVGAGMATRPGVAATMFRLLADAGIPVKMVSTSEIKVSAVIPRAFGADAVRVLHDGFGLGEENGLGRLAARIAEAAE